MRITRLTHSGVMLTLGLVLATSAQAFDLGNIMDPSLWTGGSNDYYDYPGIGGYGYPGDIGSGYGYSGLPAYGGLPGYGAFPDYYYGGIPGYGGLPGLGSASRYDYAGDRGYGYRSAPAPTESPEAAEIQRLKERIRKLEEASNQAPADVWSNQPGFPAGSSPWNVQPDYSPTSAPWGGQPAYPATTAPWGGQPANPATAAPWGEQPQTQPQR